jgi:ACR3 family arsenite efflux pump ArsB
LKTILIAVAAVAGVAVGVWLVKNKASIFRLNLNGTNAPTAPALYGGS